MSGHVHDPDYPDVDPATGDEAETEPDEETLGERPHFTLEVHDSVIGHSAEITDDV